jgi:hypothetical protein
MVRDPTRCNRSRRDALARRRRRAPVHQAMSHASEKAKAAAQVTLTGGMDGWWQILDSL